jgi:tRNA nucleotidyltransferase (CCA-adding enzyme)
VQLIARSTSDKIDVSGIAAHFGGGGHPRAAAALIKSGDRDSILAETLEILPDYIQPAITVAQIMSRAPQVLTPDTPVQEAAERMQRYGYEGYPVVEDGKIIGLLTRRGVDRALAHKLNLTAASLMEAGDTHVHPDQSIELLQTVMTDTGWGQIPVVDPESHQIVGIVTRTDLLKTLAPKTTPPGRRNLADKLESTLPPERLALLKYIAEIASKQRVALFIVGGFVRDLLLGYPSLDFDLVVEGDAIALARAVCQKFGGRVTTHKRFGTAKWFLEHPADSSEQTNSGDPLVATSSQLPATLDFITARTEFYTHPSALPTVERGSIKLDLHRRDFTINTLALRLDGRHYGELHDYWGGFNDLRQNRLRVLHSLSFVDDPTRMLRAVRYEQRYGFEIGVRTRELLLEARPLLDRVSGDRIRHELDNIFNEANALRMLARLDDLGLLKAIYPDLVWDQWIESQLSNIHLPGPEWSLEPDLKGVPLKRALSYILWLIRLPPERARRVSKRLKLPRILAEIIQYACHLRSDLPSLSGAKPSDFAARLHKVPTLAIYAAHLISDEATTRESLKKYVSQWQFIAPHTTGHILQERGLHPSPQFKSLLSTLKNAWLNGEINSEEEEAILLERLLTDDHPQ